MAHSKIIDRPSAMVGKKIASVSIHTLSGTDDGGFMRIIFTDKTECLIVGSYDAYTGESQDEYPTTIYLCDEYFIDKDNKVVIP